jgi:sigma-E factor negative regulatory protein RseB
MRHRARFALLGCLLLAAPAFAQDAAAWIARMGEAVRTLDYEGELVYAHAGQIETLRLFHAGGPDGERERLVTLTGAPREVIRADGSVTCIGTAPEPSVYADESGRPRLLAALPGADAHALQRHYAFVLGGVERIAGLPAQQVEVRPRDAFRYGYRLWLEQASGLPLKSMRFGADGRPVEQLMFTRIALGQRPSEADLAGDARDDAKRTVLVLPAAVAAVASAWTVVDPPPGFALAMQQPRADAGEHLVYSDGLANVSVYVEALDAGIPVFSGPASRGAMNLYGRVVQGRQVTVLGDVPAATVERFAQSIAAADGG